MSLYVNHCATLIQSNFKGYKERKYYKMFLPFYRRFKMLLNSVVCGWRVRRIMKLNKIEKKKSEIIKFNDQELKKKRIAIR